MNSALLLSLLIVAKGPDSNDPFPAAAAELARVARVFKIEVSTVPRLPLGAINGKPAEKRELADYTGTFVREFMLYPPELVKQCKVKRVVLCKELSLLGQRRAALPDAAYGTLYLDVCAGAWDRQYVSRVIHHEFFHMLDAVWTSGNPVDRRWESLNPGGFLYGEGGASAQGVIGTGALTDRYPGFLNHYSTTASEEDKAEVFSCLMSDPAVVERRIEKDAVLRAKVRLMKERVADFCSDANGEFWDRAKKVDRSHPARDRGKPPGSR